MNNAMKKDVLTKERFLELYYAIYEHFRGNYNAKENNYRLVGIQARFDYYNNLKISHHILNRYKTEERVKILFVSAMSNGATSLFDIVNKIEKFSRIFSDFYDMVVNSDDVFREDMIKIIDTYGSVNNCLKKVGVSPPKMLDMIKQKDIQYTTIIILNQLIGLINRINLLAPKDTMWKKERDKIIKLSSFIEVGDNEEYIQIINNIKQRVK